MSAKYERNGLNLTTTLLDYVRQSSVVETPAQARIRERTAKHPDAGMMTPPEQGQLMGLLARLVAAKRIIEVGVYTGYGTTWLAQALPPTGELIACDINRAYLDEALEGWFEAGCASLIEARLGRGDDTLGVLLDSGWANTVDMIFVDADKTGYPAYYDLCYDLLRPGGLMLFDNALWGGTVADASISDASTQALREVAAKARADERVWAAILTDADGLLAVWKQP